MFSSITILVTYIILGVPAGVAGIPWALLTGDIGPLYRWSMWIVRTGLKLGRIRIEVSGREHIPGRPAIFMANHVSNLDPPILLPLLPYRTAFFIKRSLLNIPIVGVGMRIAGFIPVDRDGRPESAKESVEAANKVLRSGVSISTFPEGTRSRTGRLLPFKKGPFYLAMESDAQVVPISIWGSEQMMTKGSLRIKPGIAHLTFHAALNPHQFATREQLSKAVRASITSGLPQHMWSEEDEPQNFA
ncbi:MAG TPA: lysophospholipid acyltransferase family protein [Acidobacteriaceae bacterium]|nr:lysophospholipid acyltransferase family protein [Acidobacteriaceae bacterium]